MQGDVTVWTDTAGLTSVTEHNSWLASGRSPGKRLAPRGYEVSLCPAITKMDEEFCFCLVDLSSGSLL